MLNDEMGDTEAKEDVQDGFLCDAIFLSHKKVGWTSTLWAADKRATGHVISWGREFTEVWFSICLCIWSVSYR